MSKPVIPLLFYPTSVLVLDDNEGFLNSFSLRLPDNIPYCLVAQPSEALKLLQNSEEQKILEPEDIISHFYDSPSSKEPKSTLEVDYGKFSISLTNPKRFNKFSCAIVDYTMPEMNGLDLLKQIYDTSIEKIMLTGTVDEKQALEALNQDIVSICYWKESTNVYSILSDRLQELQRIYFLNLSAKFSGLIEHYDEIFCNKAFASHFKEFCQKNSVIEHYVKDADGSLLLVTNDGNAYEMNFFATEELNELALMAKEAGLSEKLLAEIETRAGVPISLRDWLQLTLKEVPKKIEKLHPLPGIENLYYCYHSLGNLSEHTAEFVSFDYFMGNLWPNY